MTVNKLVLLKTVTWIACLWPLAKLVIGASLNELGADPTNAITFTTGLAALRILTLSLAVTPVRRLIPALSWIGPLRKILGLFAFFYATLHLATWVALYVAFDAHAMADDILKRRFITVGLAAWLLLLPLAATSFNWAIRKMGGRRWKRLHKLAYVAAVLGVVHYWWGVKSGVLTPITITVVLGVLLAARPVLDWAQRRRAVPRPV